eukprot:UN10378
MLEQEWIRELGFPATWTPSGKSIVYFVVPNLQNRQEVLDSFRNAQERYKVKIFEDSNGLLVERRIGEINLGHNGTFLLQLGRFLSNND